MTAPPDAELAALVDDLAQASRRDIDAVLRQLDRPQRERVAELLAHRAGDAPLPGAERPAALSPGLSPWLAERVVDAGPPDGRWRMAQAAHDALRAAARELAVQTQTDPVARVAARRGSFLWGATLGRVWSGVGQ